MKPHSGRYPEGPGVLRSLLKESAEDTVMAIVEDPSLLLYVEDLLEQFETLREALEEIRDNAYVDGRYHKIATTALASVSSPASRQP